MSLPLAASYLISAGLRLHDATWTTEVVGGEHFQRVKASGEPFIFALWHGRMLVPILRHRGQGIATMASRSRDGEVIARWLERNGYSVCRGSTTRGGVRALLELKDMLRAGRPAALTVDGPLGPPRQVQEGIVTLAQTFNAWLLPVTGSAARPRYLHSWDGYLVPRLFSKNFVVYGEPFRLGNEPGGDAAEQIKKALDEITAQADLRAGITPPPPW